MKKALIAILIVAFISLASILAFSTLTNYKKPSKPKTATAYQELSPKETPKPPTDEELLVAVNAERSRNNVAPLAEDARLDSSAQSKACDMKDNNYFDHVNPKTGVRGRDTAEQAMGMAYGYYDENLTQPTPVTTDQAMFNWINSPAHHAGMIDSKYTLTGFGVCGNDVVEHFYGPM